MLVLPEPIREAIFDRAREATRPNAKGGDGGTGQREICGIFGGRFGRRWSHVESHHPTENVAETPRTRYRIDPEEQLAVIEAVEDRGRDVVGFYHSHPEGPSEPSPTDVARATWSDRSYVIVSLGREPVSGGEATVGSWRWRGGRFEREALRGVERP